MKTIYYHARQKKSKDQPSLKDRRAIFYDNIGVSISEQKKLETNEHYIPHPSVPAKLIDYFEDVDLANNVCKLCLITQTKSELNITSKDSVTKTSDLSSNKDTISRKPTCKKQRRILKEIRSKNKNRTYYYYRRLELALIILELTDRYYVSLQTGISYKTLSELENNKDYIPRFETLNSLLRLYKDYEIANEICLKCPVRQSLNQLKREEDIINDNRKTIERKIQ